MLTNDANIKDTLTYTITTTNSAGLAQFQIDNVTGVIDVAKPLDYENTALRMTDLVVQASDGYCTSPKYQLHLQVTDVNEAPTISPDVINMNVCEGKKTFSPGYKLTDPDTIDTQRWYFDKSNSDPNGYFNIDAKTGDLMTLLDYDVDPLKPMPVSNTFRVVVEDKGGLTATAKVTVNFTECNDHAPVFDAPGYEASASECSGAGSRLIRIRATDNDTSRDDNNVIYYQGSGGAVSVNSDGDVILNHPLPAGNVITFDAYAYDRGRTPSQLRSVNPTRISVRFTPCYTTYVPIVVPTPAPTVPTTPTTTLPTTTTTKTKQDSNLPWIVIAALLGSVMLALLACMLWRYGRLCAHACNNFSCEKKCCRPRPRRLATPVARRPAERPNIEPEEKEEPPPKGPGFLFGFWKERFPDDDFKQEPQRKTLPAPGDMDAHYPHTIDAVEDPLTPQVPDTAAPKKSCVIM
ncbi:protocadherin-16-like [Physella acuta]|uniref:protocadherin-16-like n=1 Tax=Physella acuta TaxID=109671 RepID=UPI0027DD1EF9|nr:protocadherin-16-like [Physella acuta]